MIPTVSRLEALAYEWVNFFNSVGALNVNMISAPYCGSENVRRTLLRIESSVVVVAHYANGDIRLAISDKKDKPASVNISQEDYYQNIEIKI